MKQFLKLIFGSFFCGILSPGILLAQNLYPASPQLGIQSATLENIMLHQNLRDTEGPCVGRNSWLIGYGLGGFSSGEQSGKNSNSETRTESRFEQSLGGFLLGTDLNFGVDSRIGGFMAFNASRQTAESEKTNIQNYFWGIYGRKDWGKNYFLGTAAIGHAHLRETSDAAAFSAPKTGSSNAWRAFLYGEFGTEFRFGSIIFQPFWGLQYYFSSFGSFQVPGEGVVSENTIFPALKTNSLRNVIGLRTAETFWESEELILRGNVTAFWFHEFLDYGELGGGTFLNISETIPEMTVSPQKYGRDWGIIAPTLELNWGNFKFWGGYAAMFNSRETLHLGQGGVSFCW